MDNNKRTKMCRKRNHNGAILMSMQSTNQDLTNGTILLYGCGFLAGVCGVFALGFVFGQRNTFRHSRCNHRIKLDSDKVVDSFEIQDLEGKAAFCRCWHSKNFPYCDGSHIKHNQNTGDNVGPLIITGKPVIKKLD